MKSSLILIAALALAGCATSAPRSASPQLLPQPRSMTVAAGEFRVDARTVVAVPPGDAGARQAAERLVDLLRRTRGVAPGISETGGDIRLVREAGQPHEGYKLDVKPSGAVITASDDAGLLYGAITFWQLATSGADALIPAVSIADSPRFRWRGLMLDSTRHFQSPDFVKTLIDAMAAHKLNTLHWHLTDDQGWRIEIKRYPRLTGVSGWRVPASAPGAPALPRTGGFYTQDEIRDIVAYAAARGITIVPEIEMPGHALSAIRAYPELGTGAPIPPGTESDWGVFPWLYNIDDGTFTFLENVLTEVMALFPSPYIHVGGDEAVKDQWKASPAIQARMKALGVADENALQSWFIRRIERFLSGHGRKLIGWDEILEGGIAPNATVMSWRGIDGAVEAARSGHDAVLAPSPTLYLNHNQGTGPNEGPGRAAPITLAEVYAFDPMPHALTAEQQRHIIGVQANLWTEYVRSEALAAYMMFPRASAVAELGWSDPATRDFTGFAGRLAPQIDRLRALGIDAAPSAYVPEASERFDPATGRVTVTLANQVGSPIRYTLDGNAPDARSPLYAEPLALTLPTRLRAAGYRDDRLPGEFDRRYDAMSVRRRDDTQLKLCTTAIGLALEDDAPATGPRASFLIDIMNPCWIYEAAPLDGVTAIAIDVGQLPFNFQIGRDVDKIRFRAPATAAGEFEVRINGCEGERIAVLPLAPAMANPAITRLSAPIAPRAGMHDLCFTYTARGPEPLWAIDAVQLMTR
jgi:hexosaminidase